MATLAKIRSAATLVNRTLRNAESSGDGRLTKSEVFRELNRTGASQALRSATLSAYAHQNFVDSDMFLGPSISSKSVAATVKTNAKALVELDGKKRGSVKDGQVTQNELYASTNQLSRSLLRLADAL